MKELINDQEYMEGFNMQCAIECEEYEKQQRTTCPHCNTLWEDNIAMLTCPCCDDSWIR